MMETKKIKIAKENQVKFLIGKVEKLTEQKEYLLDIINEYQKNPFSIK